MFLFLFFFKKKFENNLKTKCPKKNPEKKKNLSQKQPLGKTNNTFFLNQKIQLFFLTKKTPLVEKTDPLEKNLRQKNKPV